MEPLEGLFFGVEPLGLFFLPAALQERGFFCGRVLESWGLGLVQSFCFLGGNWTGGSRTSAQVRRALAVRRENGALTVRRRGAAGRESDGWLGGCEE